jgi:serpin B
MFVTRLKIGVAVVLLVVLTCTGAGWLWHQAVAQPPRPGPEVLLPAAVLVLADDPKQARADRPELVQGNTRFALDLYHQLGQAEGNDFCSPYSISTALGMTWAGARGETADQMAKVLHFTLPQERLHPAAGALVRDLNGAGAGKKPNYQLSIANALWGQKDFGFRKDFVELTRTSYGAGLNEVDFVGAREEARQTINAWVAKQTLEKIEELLRKDDLDGDTRLVLTNAIYFKSEWETKFYKNGTRDEAFHLTAERTVKVPMMRRTANFPHAEGDSFQMVELPFAGKDLSMLVLLPKKVDGLAELEKTLTADWLGQWQKKLRATDVSVLLPRFKVTSRFELKSTLAALGMRLPFSSRADFSGMTDRREPLLISKVIHQTYIDVNEEGAEAAGATAVLMGRGAPAPRAVAFRADRPFLLLVRDNQSGSVLFLGRVVDPTK